MTGDMYYKYADNLDRVASGYPRKIADDFGPKSDSFEGVPNDVDAVWFDMNDAMLYFFKDEWVGNCFTFAFANQLKYRLEFRGAWQHI